MTHGIISRDTWESQEAVSQDTCIVLEWLLLLLKDLGGAKGSSMMPHAAVCLYVLKNWFCVIWTGLALCTHSSGEALRRNREREWERERIPFQKCKQGFSLNWVSHSLEGKPGPVITDGCTSKTGWVPSSDPTAVSLKNSSSAETRGGGAIHHWKPLEFYLLVKYFYYRRQQIKYVFRLLCNYTF